MQGQRQLCRTGGKVWPCNRTARQHALAVLRIGYMPHAHTSADQQPLQQGRHTAVPNCLLALNTYVCWQSCIKMHGGAVLNP
jgi:hypothetical protein